LPECYCIDCERHQTFAVAQKNVLCLLWNFQHFYRTHLHYQRWMDNQILLVLKNILFC